MNLQKMMKVTDLDLVLSAKLHQPKEPNWLETTITFSSFAKVTLDAII